MILLIGSGAFLEPDLTSGRTWAKQVAVLVLINNGVYARGLGARLSRLPPRSSSATASP